MTKQIKSERYYRLISEYVDAGEIEDDAEYEGKSYKAGDFAIRFNDGRIELLDRNTFFRRYKPANNYTAFRDKIFIKEVEYVNRLLESNEGNFAENFTIKDSEHSKPIANRIYQERLPRNKEFQDIVEQERIPKQRIERQLYNHHIFKTN